MHPRHVVWAVDHEEQREGEQVDADQDRYRIQRAADDVRDHRGGHPLPSSDGDDSGDDRQQQQRPISARGHSKGRFHSARLRARSCGSHAFVLECVVGHQVGLGVFVPGMVQGEALGDEAPGPGGIAAHDLHHTVDDRLPLRPVVHVLHALEQAIELGAVVVDGVFPAVVDFAVGPVEQKEEVFGVGVVGIPAPEQKLPVALAHLVLKAVEVAGADHQVDAELGKLLAGPVQARLAVGPGCCGVEIDQQRLARGRIPSVWVAGFGQQLAGLLDGLCVAAFRRPSRTWCDSVPVCRRRGRKCREGSDPGRGGRGHCKRSRSSPPYRWRWRWPAVACARAATGAADHLVLHVEAPVPDRGGHGGDQADAPAFELVAEAHVALAC